MADSDQPNIEDVRVSLLQRRAIEARVLGPLIRGFANELGTPKTLEIVRRVIVELARESGNDLAQSLGESTLEAFASALDIWKEGGALEIEMLSATSDQLDFNVTRCRFAEMYRSLGLADLGSSLSCQRDFALVEGFNPEIGLTRTQTIMEGASHCDFRFRRRDTSSS
jgi:L-2-amino-thiazoline-4-carboxylic acid hydrolase